MFSMQGVLAGKDTIAMERLLLTDFLEQGLLLEGGDGKIVFFEEQGEGAHCVVKGCIGALKLLRTSQR